MPMRCISLINACLGTPWVPSHGILTGSLARHPSASGSGRAGS
jgi:hypothetical protein